LYKFDGYIATFNALQKDGSYSANLRDAFPEIATDIPNCEEAGTLNSIVGIIATQQVNEVLKLITGTGTLLINQLLIYNSLQNTQLKIKLKSVFLKEKITKIFKAQTYNDVTCMAQNQDFQISATALKEKIKYANLEIIAVLNDLKLPFNVQQTIHINNFDADKISIDKSKTYIMVCQKGLNSYKATVKLRNKYPDLEVFSLTGGISNYK
jgi:adenylyltransferase/sulfurtransferase